ncbi:MAG: mannose-1-phosphate guanylyltransferase, partial [Bacteroidales bacterium]|nr:mannose-1-phosphate guanylyltransferase [Bacteroidales bacterium]
MIMDITVLIMAGGSGERFWPLSTKERPKQLLKLVDQERSLIRMTVDRILPLVSAERVFIATNAIQAEGVLEELPVIDPKNIIIEPAFRDTAAAVGFGCVVIGERFPGSTMIVLASDHLIKDEEGFREALSTAVGIADSRIVTLGIKPTHPETGYGYLECGELIKGQPSRVLRFCEKPALEVAESYLESGRFLWNSGMFIFRIETMMNA